jgi:hypothetical protein
MLFDPGQPEKIQPVAHTFDYFLAGLKINYIAAPASTGWRYLDWYQHTGQYLVDQPEEFSQSHYNEVLEPNKVDALNSLLKIPPTTGCIKFAPASVFYSGWSHADYMLLFTGLIKKYALRLTFLDGWQTSLGCVMEFCLAVENKLPCFDLSNNKISCAVGLTMIESVLPKLLAVNLPIDKLQNCVTQLTEAVVK